MTVGLHSFVDLFDQRLDSALHLLAKARDHAAAQGVDEHQLLDWRLADDMYPLWRQLQIVSNLAQLWAARAADVPPPPASEGEQGFDALIAAARAAKAFVAQLDPAAFVGRDDVSLTVDIGPLTPTMPLGRWLSGFATTNILFHLSMTYAILRANGVELSKVDLFAGRL